MRPMDEQQQRFLRDEFFSLTLMATVQRAKVYAPGVTDADKGKFQQGLRSCLERLEHSYGETVSEENHIGNIIALADRLSSEHGNVLAGRRFRIGTAQKALNLYLKYLWCLGKLPAPPHCPFDARVIAKLPECNGVKWTALDDPEQYRKLVKAARAKSGNTCIAAWELRSYNDAF